MDMWVIREGNVILGIVGTEAQAYYSKDLLISELGYKENDILIETYELNEVIG